MARLSAEDSGRTLALAILEEQLVVLRDIRSVLFDSVFPVELLMPDAPNFETSGVTKDSLDAIDLRETAQLIQETIVMPQLAAFLEVVGRNTHREIADVQSGARGSKQIIKDCFKSFKKFITENGAIVKSDEQVYGSFSTKIVRSGVVTDIAKTIFYEVARDVTIRLDKDWARVIVDKDAGLVPESHSTMKDALRFAHFAANAMMDDAGQAILAVDVWEDGELAMAQRDAWLHAVREGDKNYFMCLHEYIKPLLKPR